MRDKERQMRVKLLLTAVLAGFLGGCEYDEYEIELTPRGQEIRREITAWHVGSQDGATKAVRLSDEKLAAIAKLYEKRLTRPHEVKQLFVGTFRARTPSDVGGAGFYTRLDSRMGYACAYVERFRGRDEQAGMVQEAMTKVDKTVDLLVGWLGSQLSGEEGFGRLREFVDKDLRLDLKNFVVYAWMSRVLRAHKAKKEANEELMVRILQYFAERDYFSPKELPTIGRFAIEAVEHDSPDRLLSFVQRFLAAKMGVPADKPIPKALAFLSSEEAAKKSLEAYLRTTEEYKQRLREWEKQRKTTTQATQPGPLELIDGPDIDLPIFELDLFGSSGQDSLSLKLAAAAKPWATNGAWDANTGKVGWSSTLRGGKDLPVLCYALWSRPDEAFQKARFGKVVLDGPELASYCLWREGLARKEAREWRAFLASLKPQADLKKKLQAFRFSHEPPAAQAEGKQSKSYAQTAIDLIARDLPDPETQPAEKPGKPD
jgi:hypothetical protein